MEELKREHGLFITMEGIDGSGKSLMAKLLADHLTKAGHKVFLTHEPGGSTIGGSIRSTLLQSRKGSVFKETETLLFIADRAQHCREIILPCLNRNRIVICDRYTDSTLAYQGGGRGLDIEILKSINTFATGGLVPDCTFYLKIPFEIALKRRQYLLKDRMEQEASDFFKRVEAVYEDLAAEDKHRIQTIDATPSPDEVLESLNRVLEDYLGLLK